MRIVLDTNVVVSGVLSPEAPPAAVLALVAAGGAVLLVDDRILAEYERVLRRAKFRLDGTAVTELLRAIQDVAEYIPPVPGGISLPDPDDAKFIECAQAGLADFLVTGNPRHFPQRACGPVRIVSPAAFLARRARPRQGS